MLLIISPSNYLVSKFSKFDNQLLNRLYISTKTHNFKYLRIEIYIQYLKKNIKKYHVILNILEQIIMY